MARYEFKLPDIGEGIAEAEIVAWHVKVGDRIEEDQQIADMMTDKATVEMEAPVAGTVVELAGEVGDQIPIGSVLVVFETEGSAPAEQEVPLGDGAVEPTAAMEEELPTTAVAEAAPAQPAPKAGATGKSEQAVPTATGSGDSGAASKVLASPAVRQRARDLGIDLSQVRTSSDRIRHSDLDAYILYNGGGFASRGAAARA
ncbi:MAG: biotin/lipoyl-containing protein, partial [Sphingomicrobium sp.]